MEILIHIAYILLLGSFLVPDILWLRLLNIVASAAMIGYFGTRSIPDGAAVCWNFLFIAVNVVHVHKLLRERRPVLLENDEDLLYRLTFQAFDKRTFQRLLVFANWSRMENGDTLVEQGESLERFIVLVAGKVSVQVDDNEVARLGPGSLVGEMSFMTGATTSASVTALEETRYVVWPTEILKSFLAREPTVQSAMQQLIGSELVEKLRASKEHEGPAELFRTVGGHHHSKQSRSPKPSAE